MELLDAVTVQHQGKERSVELFAGDLAQLPESEAVDVLIVSAFPDDYAPTASSLIGALAAAGISVADLAKDKEVDLRQFSSCWLSRAIMQPGVHFRRILCFEPAHRGRAPEVVGDIFRSLVPFTTGTPPVSQIAMPLVASGDQGESAEVMLEALADASVHWLSAGLPVDRIKIVLKKSAGSASVREAFAKVKRRHAEAVPTIQARTYGFDVFISYSHANKEAVDEFVGELKSRRPGLRVFVDRLELRPGAAWQQHIFESLEDSRKVICVLTPEYLQSKVCKEEFHMAALRHREAEDGVMLPLYLRSAELPIYMRVVQYEDAREGEPAKLVQSVDHLLRQL